MFLLNFFLIILNFFVYLFISSIKLQYDALFKLLDLIENFSNSNKKIIKLKKQIITPQFVLITVNFLFINLYGVFVLQYDYTGQFFNLKEINKSPYVFYRQIYPQLIWQQTDSLYGISAFICFLVYFHFSIQPMMDTKIKVLVDQNSNKMTVNGKGFFSFKLIQKNIYFVFNLEISPETANKIKSFHKQARKYINLTTISFYVNTMFCFTVVIIWINNVYKISPLSIIFWFFMFPLLFFYFVNSKFNLKLFIFKN